LLQTQSEGGLLWDVIRECHDLHVMWEMDIVNAFLVKTKKHLLQHNM